MTALDWPPDIKADTFTAAELEAMVLRGLVWSKARRDAIFAILEPVDFQRGAHGLTFAAIRDLHFDREPVTFASLSDRLDHDDHLQHVGGGAFVASLCGGVYEGDPLLLATFLAEHSRKNRLRETAKGIVTDVEANDFDADQAAELLTRNARSVREFGIDRPADCWDTMVSEAIEGVDKGETTGFPKLNPHYRVPKGLLTITTGMPGSGKSTFLDNVMVNLAALRDWRFAVFSPETAPTTRHMRRMASLLLGAPVGPHTKFTDLDKAKAFLSEHFEWINSTESVTVAEIVRRAEIIHRRRPIHGLLIDPWNEVEHARDRNVREDEYISAELTRLRRFARRSGAHVWVIAHPTKLHKRQDGDYDPPTPYDISGGAQWRNKADFALCVHRRLTGGPTKVIVQKVRFADHGELGAVEFEFDRNSEQFFEPGTRPKTYTGPPL